MTQTLLALALLALAQSPDTTTYADAATEALIVQGRGRHAYQDSLVTDYSALVRTRIDAGFGPSRFARVPPILAHETAARITWALPNNLKVDVLGERAASTFPNANIEAEFDRPWFIPRSLGDSIRMVDDELPTTAALHPLAPGAGAFYRYAITDSLTMVVPGRTVRAIGVRVEPKQLGPSLVAGTMWFDSDTYEVVRFTFVFLGQYTWVSPDEATPDDSAGARKDNVWAQRIVKLEADLEYALYDRLYWMPYRQLVQLTVDIPWFLNLKVPVRFLTTFSEYAVNQSVLPEFEVSLDSVLEETDYGDQWRRRRSGRHCAHPIVTSDILSYREYCNEDTGYTRAGPGSEGGRWEIHYPPRDSLQTYAAWGDEIELNLRREDEERIKASIAALAELEEQLPASWVGRMPHHVALESFADVFRFNRVQGVSLGGGYQILAGPKFTSLIGRGRYSFADKRLTGTVTLRRDAPGGRLDVMAFREVREVEPWTTGLGFGSSLNAIFAGNDDADYYLALGGGLRFSSYGRGLLRNAQLGVMFERQRSLATVASSGINDRFGGSGVFPINPRVAEGDYVRAFVRRRSSVGPVELSQGMEGLVGSDVFSTRFHGAARLPFRIFDRTGELNLRAGALAGDRVLQMLYRVGGPRTVRGFDYGERRGDAFWSAQLDFGLWRRGAISPVIFADMGDATFSAFDPLIGVGGGVSFLDGFMRLNLSKGLEPDRDLRFDLLFRAPR
jgi:hypothetical protein